MEIAKAENTIIRSHNNTITDNDKGYKHSLNSYSYIKSPLNYIGGKHKLLTQIIPLFPNNINCFVDLFTGGCNVGINVSANNIICNDNLVYLIELYNCFKVQSIGDIINHIETQINKYNLSITNGIGYNELRKEYNSDRYHLDLFVLIAFSFNHQIRFNSSHHFNNPFGRNRSSYNVNMKSNLISFIQKIQAKNISFQNDDFRSFDLEKLNSTDFVYCDPPYLITTGTYNDGKRGFRGWSEHDEIALLSLLSNLNSKNIKFALSNVLLHKGKSNEILNEWINDNKYYINNLRSNYSNSSYHTNDRSKNSTHEVLITNYQPHNIQSSLF